MAHTEETEQERCAIAWANDYLIKHHDPLKAFQVVKKVPWSSIYKITTSSTSFYLKQAAEPFAIEIVLLPYLSRYYPVSLPNILATNPELNAFLMRDSGEPLRHQLQEAYDVQLVLDAIDQYTKIQLGMIAHVDELLALHVLDWRLSRLPSLYLELLNQRETLSNDGLRCDEIERLLQMHPQVVNLCEALSNYQIPETIEHGDFHDNNVLLSKNKLIINDWGDAVITHPFFSLTSCLSSMRRNHFIEHSNPYHRTILDNTLRHWAAFEPMHSLKKAFSLANRLRHIKFSLSFYRITLCGTIPECYKGYLAEALRAFLQAEEGKCI